MGVDFSIVIYPYNLDRRLVLGYDRLSFSRNYELYDKIGKFNLQKLFPNKLYWYGDDGLEELTEDAYGTDLEYCYAGEFNKLKYKKSDIGKLINQSDYAIIQYLIMLPEKYIVVLYWH